MEPNTNEQVPQQAAPSAQQSNASQGSSADTHKILAIVGYIFPILFFIPLLSAEGKQDVFAMFHANQQLNLLIAGIALWVLMMIVGGIVPFFFLLFPLVQIAFLVFMVLGIINAVKGEMKELPAIGHFRFLK